jgi:hypothetical protein
MENDPGYITAAKALLGEREVEGMRKGELGEWLGVLAPFVFMGRGGKGPGGLRMRPPGEDSSLLGDIMFGPGKKPSREAIEGALPPETKALLDKVRASDIGGGPTNQQAITGPNGEILPDPAQGWGPTKNDDDYFGQMYRGNLPWQGGEAYPGDVFNFEALPYAEPPFPRGAAKASDIELPPPIKITHEDLPFGQDYVHISPQEIEEASTSGGSGAGDFYSPHDYNWYLHFKGGGDFKYPWQLKEGPEWGYPPAPKIRLEEPPGTVHMAQGGVVEGLDDEYFGSLPIQLFPNTVPIPTDTIGFPPEPFPYFDYTQTRSPDQEALDAQNVQPEHFDSNDYIGGANYYYVSPQAAMKDRPTPPPAVNNYYGAADDYHANRFANLASTIGSSLPPASKSDQAQQVAMLNQWAAMQEAGRRFDAQERRRRLQQEKYETENRFGPPTDAMSQRLLNSDVNRDYMRDFYPQPQIAF